MLYLVALCALFVASPAQAAHRHFPFDSIFGKDILHSHEMDESAFHEAVRAETQRAATSAAHASQSHSYIACGPIAELKGMRQQLLAADASLADDHVRTVFQSRTRNTGCLSVHAPRTALEAASIHPYRSEGAGSWAYSVIPQFLKVSSSAMQFVSDNSVMGASHKMDGFGSSEHTDLPHHLEIGLSLGAVRNQHPSKHATRLSALAARATHGTDSPLHQAMSAGWQRRAAAFGSRAGCSVDTSKVVARSDFVLVHDVHQLSKACLSAVVEALSADPAVNTIRVGQQPHSLNHDAKGMIETGQPAQTGTAGYAVYPYTLAGLNGQDQVVGVMDTGLDDLSCYFADPTNCAGEGGSSCLTPRDGQIYKDRRKVIQYVPYADETDQEGGHGSHVVGSIVGLGMLIEQDMDYGQVTNPLRGYNGVAAAAKVAFEDIGDADGSLRVLNYLSLSEEAFPVSYRAGARVHSNSWGGGIFYNRFSFEVDKYTYENDDFLVLAAAGNEGNYIHAPIILNPCIAKNALCVGSAQVRDEYTDVPFDETTMSYFSSNGPTMEGRTKPDIVSSGSSITSCRASDPLFADWAYYYGYSQVTCATQQMSGTSMATPVTAGGALLVRQYFESANFWAANCGSEYSSCSGGAFSPSAYFVKATLLHSGTPIARYGAPADSTPVSLTSTPNVYEGYGYATLSNVLPLSTLDQPFKLYVNDAMKLSEGNAYEWTVTVADTGIPMRATIAWYDPYGEFGGMLIHDLDLTVTSPNGTVYYGNNGLNRDELNPNEQVTIDMPSCDDDGDCVYTIRVSAASVSMAAEQKFALVLTTDGVVSEAEAVVVVPEEKDLFFEMTMLKQSGLSLAELKSRGAAKAQADSKKAARRPVDLEGSRWRAQSEAALLGESRKLTEKAMKVQPSEVRRLEDGTMSIRVDLDPFTIAFAEEYVVELDFPAGGNFLSSVDFEFNHWDSYSGPANTNVDIITPYGEFSVHQWPFEFAGYNMLGWYYPFTLGAYKTSFGTAPYLSASSEGTYTIAVSLINMVEATEYKAMSLTFNFIAEEPPIAFVASNFMYYGSNQLTFFDFEVSLPGQTSFGDDLCWRPQYFWYEVVSGECYWVDDFIATDATSEASYLKKDIDWTFNGGQENIYQFIDFAPLRNSGLYSIGLVSDANNCPGASITAYMAFTPTECQSGLESVVTVESSIEVTLDTCVVSNPEWIGDGYCDWDTPGYYNSASCGFDGGDCCEETCQDGDEFQCGVNGYVCKDPQYQYSFDYSFSDEFSFPSGGCMVGVEAWIGDGYCDQGNYNSMECGWDGGDCCEETCQDGDEYQCGGNGYTCLDPSVSGSMVYSYDVYSYDFVSGEVYSGETYSGEMYSGEMEMDSRRLTVEDEIYSGEYVSVEFSYEFSGEFSGEMYSMDYSNMYSAEHSGATDNTIVMINSFAQEGNLEYITVDLAPQALDDAYNFVLGVVVIDPVGRFLQVGTYDSMIAYQYNSGTSAWPGNWLASYQAARFMSTRDVRATGLSSLDYDNVLDGDRRRLANSEFVTNLRSSALRKRAKEGPVSQRPASMTNKRALETEANWEVYVLLAISEYEFTDIEFSGTVSLKFDSDATFVPTASPTVSPTAEPTLSPTAHPTASGETNMPTAKPTAQPSASPTSRPSNKPTRSPTRTPTRAPTGSNRGTYIEFNTTIQYDGVDCNSFVSDANALEAARRATTTSLNPGLDEDEVQSPKPESCAARRLTFSNFQFTTVKRGLQDVTLLSYTTVANINNLGESDPEAAYDNMKTSLDDAITSGDYTALVVSEGESLNTSTLNSVAVTEIPTYSDLVVFEVQGSGGGGDDDDNTGAIVGGVIGGVVFLVIVGGIVYWFCIREPDDGDLNKGVRDGSSTSTHTATVGGSGTYKKTGTDDPALYDNPIFTKEGGSGGKAADNYGGL